MARLPTTTAHLRVTRQSWEDGCLEGELEASGFHWSFIWRFRVGELKIEPSLGRALIKNELRRFLAQRDYQLEPGGDYNFTIRARF
jgi:Protein of unknown function (DUF3146)